MLETSSLSLVGAKELQAELSPRDLCPTECTLTEATVSPSSPKSAQSMSSSTSLSDVLKQIPQLNIDTGPEQIKVTSLTHTTVTVTWSPAFVSIRTSPDKIIEYTINYELEMQKIVNSDPTQPPLISKDGWLLQHFGTTNAVLIRGLMPNQEYAIRVVVKPMCNDPAVFVSTCPPSPLLLIRTLSAPPKTPSPPALTDLGADYLLVDWEEPSESAGLVEYALQVVPPPKLWAKGPMLDGWFEVYRGGNRSFLLDNLQPATEYTLRLAALNASRFSEWSTFASFTTKPDIPNQPEPPHISFCDTHQLGLGWLEPPDNGSCIYSYILEKADGFNEQFSMCYEGLDTFFTVDGLQPGVTYLFRLRAINGVGESMWSAPCIGHTLLAMPETPPPPAMIASEQDSIQLCWKSSDFAETYIAEVQPVCPEAKETMLDQWIPIYQGNARTCMIENLRPGCRYRARVRAGNMQGICEPSFPTDIFTAASVPSKPPGCPVLDWRDGALHVSWTPPKHDGGSVIKSYELEVRTLKSEDDKSEHFDCVYVGPDCSALLTDIPPSTWFQLRLAAINKFGRSACVMTNLEFSKPVWPSRPHHVKLLSATGRTIQLQWEVTEVSSVKSYVLQARKQADNVQFERVYNGFKNVYTLEGLIPATEYVFRVKACSDVGRSSWSEVAVYATSAAPPGRISTLQVKNDEVRGYMLCWTAPEVLNGAAITAYQAEMDSGSHAMILYSGLDLSCPLKKLLPGREYEFRVRSANTVGWSNWSQSCSLRTPPDVPGPPGALSFSNKTATTVKVKIARPDEDSGSSVVRYEIEYMSANNVLPSLIRSDGSSCKISGLSPNETYTFQARALNGIGAGPFGPLSTITTPLAPPSPPTSLFAGLPTEDGVEVEWESPSACSDCAECIGYEMEAVAEGKIMPVVRQACNAKFSHYFITGLMPGVSYCIRLRSIGGNGAGHGNWSDAVLVDMPALEKGAAIARNSIDLRPRKSVGLDGLDGRAPASIVAPVPQKQISLALKTTAAKGRPKRLISRQREIIMKNWKIAVCMGTLIILMAMFIVL